MDDIVRQFSTLWGDGPRLRSLISTNLGYLPRCRHVYMYAYAHLGTIQSHVRAGMYTCRHSRMFPDMFPRYSRNAPVAALQSLTTHADMSACKHVHLWVSHEGRLSGLAGDPLAYAIALEVGDIRNQLEVSSTPPGHELEAGPVGRRWVRGMPAALRPTTNRAEARALHLVNQRGSGSGSEVPGSFPERSRRVRAMPTTSTSGPRHHSAHPWRDLARQKGPSMTKPQPTGGALTPRPFIPGPFRECSG
jgi:hypothetical protein